MSRIKVLTTIREQCEFWGCIFPQNRKTTYIQRFSQYSFILLMNLLALFSFSLLHTGNKPELSHFNMLVMLSVQKHFRLLVLSTSFLSHVFSRTGSLQNNFDNNLFHIAAVLYTRAVFNHSCVLLVQYYNLILIFFSVIFRCLVCLQSSCNCTTFFSMDEQLVWVCTAKQPLEFLNKHLTCGHFQFAGN